MRKVLVVSDPIDIRGFALARGCQLASENCADLCVLELTKGPRSDKVAVPHGRFMAIMDEARRLQPCIGTISVCAVTNRPAAIAEAALHNAPDLIVMRNLIVADARDDRPFELVERVLRRTGLPVLAVQNQEIAPYRRVLALVDQGETANRTIDLALTINPASMVFAADATAKRAVRSAVPADLCALVEQTIARRPDIVTEVKPIIEASDVGSALIRTWNDVNADLVVAVTRQRHNLINRLHQSEVRELLAGMPFDMLVQEMPRSTSLPGSKAARPATPAF